MVEGGKGEGYDKMRCNDVNFFVFFLFNLFILGEQLAISLPFFIKPQRTSRLEVIHLVKKLGVM